MTKRETNVILTEIVLVEMKGMVVQCNSITCGAGERQEQREKSTREPNTKDLFRNRL